MSYIKGVVKLVTLADKLGTTTHLSPLLQKAGRLGMGPAELEVLAVQRGCVHYRSGDEPQNMLAGPELFSNEELAVALLSPAMPYSPHGIRCGAAMVGAPDNSPQRLARLAVLERAVQPLRYVAEAARQYEPENPFWSELLLALPPAPPPKSGAMPHATRFVSMTGLTPNGSGRFSVWLRPKNKR